jgi:TrpR-related protein YerC/YecD
LCTIKEVEAMAQRLQAAKLLMENKTYETIIAQTDISSASLSRVSKCVHYGTGGYRSVLEKQKK